MSKCIVHTLLSLCVSTFNEESLGNPQVHWIICVCVQGLHSIMDEQSKVLVNKKGSLFFVLQTLLAIVTETLTHPRLRLEFWKQVCSIIQPICGDLVLLMTVYLYCRVLMREWDFCYPQPKTGRYLVY